MDRFMKRTNVPLAELMASKNKVQKIEKNAKPAPADDNEKLQKDLEAVEAVDSELKEVLDAQAKEVMEINAKYLKKKEPLWEKRQKLIENIPEFWFRVLLAHPAMEEAISDQDQDVFMHLTRLHVAEHLDGSEQDYRITFAFKENPFFENKELWKEYRFKEDEATVTSSPITWKDTPEAKGIKDTLVPHIMATLPEPEWKNIDPSFFSVFDPTDRDFKMGDVLREEVWNNAFELYMSAEIVSEDEEEEGEEGEGDEA